MKSIRLAIRIFPWAVLLLMALTAVLVIVGRVDRTIEASGEVGVSRYHLVRPKVSGFVAEILVEPGDVVTRGQVLLRLADHRFDREAREARQVLREVESQLEQARSELGLLRSVIHPLERSRQQEQVGRKDLDSAVSASQVSELELELEVEHQRYSRAQELGRHGLASQQQIQEAAQAKLIAEQRLLRSRLEAQRAFSEGQSAQSELQLLAGEQKRRIADLEGRISQLSLSVHGHQSDLRRIAKLRELHALRAGLDGVVLSQGANDLRDRYVQAGEELFQIIDPASIHFTSRVPEQTIIQVRSGQVAQVEIAGLPVDRFEAFSGKVSRVALQPESAGDGPSLYPVQIHLDKPWLALAAGRYYLRSGMRGNAKIAFRADVSILRALYEFLIGAPQVPESSPSGSLAGLESPTLESELTLESSSLGNELHTENGASSSFSVVSVVQKGEDRAFPERTKKED